MKVIESGDVEFVRVSGRDAIGFLQGQTSCNVEALTPRRSLSGALCNLKGRVIADFRLLMRDGACLLQTTAGMGAVIIDTLARYAVFSKVELHPDDSIEAVFGVLGDTAAHGLQARFGALPDADHGVIQTDEACIIRIPGVQPRYQLWCQGGAALHALRSDPKFAVNGAAALWSRADIEAGIVHVDGALSEKHVPQLLNYDISGVIDFDKGCYTGQEVVARMYYRGKAKKRLFLISSDTAISPASQVMERATGSTAAIIRYSNLDDCANGPHLALAILSTGAVANAATSGLGLSDQPDSTVRVLPLPYADSAVNAEAGQGR